MTLSGARSLAAAILLVAPAARAEKAVTTFPPPVDSAPWTALLRKYVDARGLVSYARWKADAADRRSLAGYLAELSRPGGEPNDREQTALLINAYNAGAIAEILERYPVEGIRSIPRVFTAEEHRFGGGEYSLDEIEHTAVRLGGFTVHATLVCASLSCPPLDRRAFRGEDLVAHAEERMGAWMARGDLFQFDPARNVARVSREFDWYRADFAKAGVASVLARFAPPEYRDWLRGGGFALEYLPYDWRLNAGSPDP